MGRRRLAVWAGVAGALLAGGLEAAAQGRSGVPLERLTPEACARVRAVTDRPTLSTQGPQETFPCHPPTYRWLLDHPDQAARLWRLIGARCADVRDAGGGRFSWSDGQGSHVTWEALLRDPDVRVIYAEGTIRPGVLLPSCPFRAVVVVRVVEGDDGGRPAVRHRMELLVQTDSHAASLAARLLGASAPRLAEQYVGQLETFFGALAWYLGQHPEHAHALAEQLRRPPETDRPMPPQRAPAE
jgi:hypothetical protein